MGAKEKNGKEVGKQQSTENATRPKKEHSKHIELDLEFSKLVAAVSYMTDVTPDGCRYHSWRVALVAAALAAEVSPEIQRDVFYAALLHDIGAVSARKHITKYSTLRAQLEDTEIRNHPNLGAAILETWLPGMRDATKIVKSHHEWWDGSGYPENRFRELIPQGSQVVAIADAGELAGSFHLGADVSEKIRTLSEFAGRAWPRELYEALTQAVTNSEFCIAVMDPASLPTLFAEKLAELGPPEELNNEEGVERILHVFAVLLDARDSFTSGHSLRTARLAKAFVQHMKLSEEEAAVAYRAGLVHDCGRVGVPMEVVDRQGRLNEHELNLVRKHAQMTIRTLGCLPDCPSMAELGNIAGHDHERWDGAGYPDHLSGENIPLISRVLSVVDSFDAMTATTTYRMLSPKCAVMRLKDGSGTQFDPQVVDAMISALESGALDAAIPRAA